MRGRVPEQWAGGRRGGGNQIRSSLIHKLGNWEIPQASATSRRAARQTPCLAELPGRAKNPRRAPPPHPRPRTTNNVLIFHVPRFVPRVAAFQNGSFFSPPFRGTRRRILSRPRRNCQSAELIEIPPLQRCGSSPGASPWDLISVFVSRRWLGLSAGEMGRTKSVPRRATTN